MAKTINWEHKEPKRSTGDNLRRILKDKDAMMEVARLATEDQREAMTNNTREGIEIVKEVDVLLQEGKYIEAMDVFLTAYKEQQEYYNHQLQKARAEEREKMMQLLHLSFDTDHSKLDQDNK